jgi:hypothetical protein
VKCEDVYMLIANETYASVFLCFKRIFKLSKSIAKNVSIGLHSLHILFWEEKLFSIINTYMYSYVSGLLAFCCCFCFETGSHGIV